jgi:hypothetical protein
MNHKLLWTACLDNPFDWARLLIAADAFDEEGEEDFANALRYCGRKEKWPRETDDLDPRYRFSFEDAYWARREGYPAHCLLPTDLCKAIVKPCDYISRCGHGYGQSRKAFQLLAAAKPATLLRRLGKGLGRIVVLKDDVGEIGSVLLDGIETLEQAMALVGVPARHEAYVRDKLLDLAVEACEKCGGWFKSYELVCDRGRVTGLCGACRK